LRFQRERQSQAKTNPSVSILKPLHGSEPGLFPRLAVLCDQDYAQEIQIVCGTQAAADPALHVVGLLKRRYPKTQIDVVVDERSHGTNRKISNLVNMEALPRHDLIILSDSDILVDEQFISRVAAEMEDLGPGVLSCANYGLAAGGTSRSERQSHASAP
jgi:ceramide glucosyltransferase